MSAPAVTTTQKGAAAEQAVRSWCEAKGWIVLETNFARKVGEIDLIAMDGATLVVAEVRSRQNGPVWVSPFETVTHTKRRKIEHTTQRYLQETRLKAHAIRFDIFAWDGKTITWMPRAWG